MLSSVDVITQDKTRGSHRVVRVVVRERVSITASGRKEPNAYELLHQAVHPQGRMCVVR